MTQNDEKLFIKAVNEQNRVLKRLTNMVEAHTQLTRHMLYALEKYNNQEKKENENEV